MKNPAVRIIILLVIGAVAIGIRYKIRTDRIAENERRAAAAAAANAAIDGEESAEAESESGIPESQKTPLMKRADELAAEVALMEKALAADQKRLADMDAWLKNYLESEVEKARTSNNQAALDSAQSTYNERLAQRNQLEQKNKGLQEELAKAKVELTNTRLDIVTGKLP